MASNLKNLPDLGQAVTDLAEDVQKIMVSLYEFQKSLTGPNTSSFVNVRKDLKSQWEILRIYLQRCHGFGADVLTLKDALEQESKDDLVEFLVDMKASANELQEISTKLKDSDMSEAFSKGTKSANDSNSSPNKAIQNDNLRAFVATFPGANKHKSVFEIDRALPSIKSHIYVISLFWDDTSAGCDSLINDVRAKSTNLTISDAEKITSNWKGYQRETEKAISSITKTADAILVEGVPNVSVIAPPPASTGTSTGMNNGGNNTVGRRFGLGTWVGWLWRGKA